jgi:CzcA family heavy metal efflux pump
MLQALVKFSLQHRVIVAVLACVLMLYGFFAAQNAKLDVFPNFVQPQVAIQTECPGMGPDQVELLVTAPLETAVNGLAGVETLRSESIEGLSVLTVVFGEGTDVYRARQTLSEKITETAGKLPATVKYPRMTPLTSSTMDLLKLGLASDRLSPMELRSFADWTLKPRLLSVPGVAKCSIFGGAVRQLQIQILPERLQAFGLALPEVMAAARVSTAVLGAGYIETHNQRIMIQTEGQAITPEALGNVVVAHANGLSVRLQDVARVVEGAEPKYGDTVIQGRWGVLLTLSSQSGANTLEVTRALEAALKELKPVFEQAGVRVLPRLHRPATFIEAALSNMKQSLLLGGILVSVVLFILLGSVRTACISLAAIPISLCLAVIAMEKLGISINTMTLGGLVIALGEVVDDSIIDVENIFRRLRENRHRPQPLPVFHVVLSASLEVRRAVVFATFIVALVFLPVLTLTGLQGSFFSPLALSYILAIMASLLVALTVTPALSFILFGRGVRERPEPILQRWLKAAYQRLLGLVARRPRTVTIVVAGLCVAALALVPRGGELLPEFREGHYVLQVSTAPGTSLPEMLRIGARITSELLKIPHVATVEQQVGRAELGEDPWGTHRSEFHVDLEPVSGEQEEKMADAIRGVLGKFPGIQYDVMTFLGDRIGETISGETAPVVVNVFGDDLDLLDAKAREVAEVLSGIRGNADVQFKSPPGAPRVEVRLLPERLLRYGFRPVEVLEAVQTAYQGAVVAQTHRGSQVADVAVILDEAERSDAESLGALQLRSAQGALVPLRELAEVYPAASRFSILHEGARRRQTVTCATSGRDVSSFVSEAKRQIQAKVKFPAGTYVVFSGAAEAQARGRRQLVLHSAVAALGILLLLSLVFRNWRNLLLVLVNLPFALVGGVLAVWLSSVLGESSEGGLTLGALVGFVTLFGITSRNSIMMISHFEHLVKEEGMTWGLEAAMRGAGERLMPVLMTATVTGLGLLPLALGSGEAGREIEGPMAIVILGGLITSTVLNLLVLPTLALRYGQFTKEAEG